MSKLRGMRCLTRRIALLLILVFTANVQCWAFNIGDEMSHDLAGQSLVMMQHTGPAQSESHNCNQMGHHCCHALNHLLGQVSDDFSVGQGITPAKPYSFLAEDAASRSSENIYHPPRIPSLT